MKTSHLLIVFGLAMFNWACQPMATAPIGPLVDGAMDRVGCKSLDEALQTEVYRRLLEGEALPNGQSLRRATQERAIQLFGMGSQNQVESFAESYADLYGFLSEEVAQELNLHTPMELLEALTALELGDRSDPVRARLQRRYQQLKAKMQKANLTLQSNCQQQEPPPALPTPDADKGSGDYWDQLRNHLPPAVFGGRKVLATAYQSCDTLAMPPIAQNTPPVQGVRTTTRHPAGGWHREIFDLKLTQDSHYYIRQWRPAANDCADVPTQPLIYDFGGKPKASSELDSDLDLFSDSGSGQASLGIDCSGFVFSALATAGLRVKKDVRLKAVSVYGISARMFKDPNNNGLSCLRPVSPAEQLTLQPGDLIATTGHIVYVDEVGPDPFGLSGVQRIEDCAISSLSYKTFDFVILQSSPTKNGMGINRIAIKDYLPESPSYRTGLLAYAEAVCKAGFGKKVAPSNSTTSIVRHRGGQDCFDRPITLVKQSCLSQCQL